MAVGNQLTGFYMYGTLSLNEVNQCHVLMSIFNWFSLAIATRVGQMKTMSTNWGIVLGYLFWHSKNPALSRLLITLIKMISN